MALTQIAQPQYSDPNRHCTGMAPSALALGAARASLLHVANYRQHGTIMVSEPAIDDNSAFVPIFYPVSLPDGVDSAPLRLFIDVQMSGWREANTGPQSGWIIITGAVDTPSKKYELSQADDRITDHALGKFNGPRFTFDVEVMMTRSGTADYGMIRVSNNGLGRFGRVTAIVAPRPSAALAPADVWNVAGGNLSPGKRLIGFARGSGSRGSVDALAYHQWSDVANERTALSASRTCLFSWAQPSGRTVAGGAQASWFNTTFRPLIFPRMLRGDLQSTSLSMHLCVAHNSDANWTLLIRDSRRVSATSITIPGGDGSLTFSVVSVTLTVNLPVPDTGIEFIMRVRNDTTAGAGTLDIRGMAFYQQPLIQLD